jgi:hypothetical protein
MRCKIHLPITNSKAKSVVYGILIHIFVRYRCMTLVRETEEIDGEVLYFDEGLYV